MNHFSSNIEKVFASRMDFQPTTARIPYIMVENFPRLGLLTALRFLEWVQQNPQGVISLPTGKTPEHFIKWTQHIINNWETSKVIGLRDEYGFNYSDKPNLTELNFVQIDEFYPISSAQHNSFYNYVKNFYIDGFGMSEENALLINCDQISLYQGKHFTEIFPELKVDLSLRYRAPLSKQEELQKESIFILDQWCSNYESKINQKGGIGFFLGGIGPDGHIAFNIKGSDIFSTTRLMETNFETQAVSAGDLGGIEVSRNRLVITIGLETITRNKDAVAIIFAAGEAKAGVVKNAIESEISNVYPGTVLQKLPNARYYITKGASVQLEDAKHHFYNSGPWTMQKSEKAVIELCLKLDKYGENLDLDDLKNDPFCKYIPDLGPNTVSQVQQSIREKINRGLEKNRKKTFYHTGPHHDDIQLGLMPMISHDLRDPNSKFDFTVLTSGFTAVTNSFLLESLQNTAGFLNEGKIEMIEYPDFFEKGYLFKFDKDVSHFLNQVANHNTSGQDRGLSHRIVRAIVSIFGITSKTALKSKISDLIIEITESYDGQKNSKGIQTLKGMIREFEEELVWAHYGVQVRNIHHLRLGFYTGDIFTPQPERERDVIPILEQLRELQPEIISLALDPEGSGPDTHYKVLQAIAAAIKMWGKERDISNVRVIGYRNVWFRFEASEADVIVPVSLNSMASLDDTFSTCYLSQVDAPFPSYLLNGKFSTLTQQIWVDQMKKIQYLLGKDYFYDNANPRIRGAHGLLFYRDMNVDTFIQEARELEKSMEG